MPCDTYLLFCNVHMEARNALDLDPRSRRTGPEDSEAHKSQLSRRRLEQRKGSLLPEAPDFSNTMVASTRLSALAILIALLASGGMFVKSAPMLPHPNMNAPVQQLSPLRSSLQFRKVK